VALQTLDVARPCVAAGIARAALEEALEFAKARMQFGRAIFENQTVSFAMADMATSIDAARLLTLRACSPIESGGEFTKEGSTAKVFATKAAEQVCSKAMHLLGSSDYSRDGIVEKYCRDAKAPPILEGTSEI